MSKGTLGNNTQSNNSWDQFLNESETEKRPKFDIIIVHDEFSTRIFILFVDDEVSICLIVSDNPTFLGLHSEDRICYPNLLPGDWVTGVTTILPLNFLAFIDLSDPFLLQLSSSPEAARNSDASRKAFLGTFILDSTWKGISEVPPEPSYPWDQLTIYFNISRTHVALCWIRFWEISAVLLSHLLTGSHPGLST